MPEAMLPAARPGRGWNGGVPGLPRGSSHAVAYGDARTSVWQLTVDRSASAGSSLSGALIRNWVSLPTTT